MSQQALDLRSSVQAVRRHKKVFGAILALGVLIGAAYAVLKPPLLSSTALVVLPQVAASQNAQAEQSGTTNNEIATQVVIASSYPVLEGALPHTSPPMSLQTLQSRIQVTSLAGSIVSISAEGKTAAQAETTANAVAGSYVAYITSAKSPMGRVAATVLQKATTATGTKLTTDVALYGVAGLLGGALVGAVAALVLSNNERRLRGRDAIANSIGAPVLASLPVSHPSGPTAWVRLLQEYKPAPVHALALIQMLRQVGAGGDGSVSLTVLSLSSDPGALALGPQLAAFAADQGIPTALVVGPQQDANATATLRTACAARPQSSAEQRKPLQLVTADDGKLDGLPDGFAVVVMTVDGRSPVMPRTVHTTATVLGVSSGTATAEELARAATAAVADGRDIAGILVADPDPDDQSTGRIPRLAPLLRRQLPTQVNDVPTATEISR